MFYYEGFETFILHIIHSTTEEMLAFHLQQEPNWRKRLHISQSRKNLTELTAGLVQSALFLTTFLTFLRKKLDLCISGSSIMVAENPSQ